MIRLLVVLAVLFACPVSAQQVAQVRSGEHGAFSRLVVRAPGVSGWRMGRTVDGYELALPGGAWRFDVSGVFEKIPRDRLASIWADPATGTLRLGIACACHAVPFDFPPGLIVIDIRNGPAPRDSVYELALSGEDAGPISARPVMRPKARPDGMAVRYDWLANVIGKGAGGRDAISSRQPAAPDLSELRDALLMQMGKGMAEGVVDRADLVPPPPDRAAPIPPGIGMRVAMGELPGIAIGSDRPEPGHLAVGGQRCLSDDALGVQDWGQGADLPGSLADTRAGLVGEFDRTDPARVEGAVHRLIYLGFGAEARSLLQAFDPKGMVTDRPVLLALSHLVDGDQAQGGPFAGMGACDTAAALWAMLSQGGPGPDANLTAMLRAFSALPPHLRRHLGPILIDRLLAAGLTRPVQSVWDAIERGTATPDPNIEVLAMRLDLAQGRAEEGNVAAAQILSDPGPSAADAVIALVEATLAQGLPLPASTVTTIEALLREHAGGRRENSLIRSLILAKAASGNGIGAIADLPRSPGTVAQVWQILAHLAPDSDIMTLAILPSHADKPAIAPETADQIATRLLGLGFPDAALHWIGASDPAWPASRRILAGQAELMRRDGRMALRVVAGLGEPEAARIRAEALEMLGDARAATDAWAAAGDLSASARAATWSQDWAETAAHGEDLWKAVASGMQSGDLGIASAQDGPLARARSLAEQSVSDRTAIAALLQTVAQPQNGAEPNP